jgi:peptidoglycan/LPS O-acetylase OafA/YrhL
MKTPERVLGWDLLRGLCAIAVTCYHLLYWQKVTELHVLGTYGVYLFFVLSGASLAYTYAGRIHTGQFSFRSFLWVRYLRLAPLYLALMLLVLPWKLVKDGATLGLLGMYVSNALFVFGFFNPSTHAVLVGGWSLGIEAIFYLLFPLLILSFRSRYLAWGLFGVLLALQLGWVYATLGQSAAAPHWEAYHQVPAFAAYFMGGCMIGVAHRKQAFDNLSSSTAGVLALLAGFALMLAVNPARGGEELIGWRGLLLTGLCFLLVHIASRLQLQSRLSSAAQQLGDATYGLYLLHPVIFFGLTYAVLPRLGVASPEQWSIAPRLLLGVAVLFSAFGLALLSEKYFERPLRDWSKRRS